MKRKPEWPLWAKWRALDPYIGEWLFQHRPPLGDGHWWKEKRVNPYVAARNHRWYDRLIWRFSLWRIR